MEFDLIRLVDDDDDQLLEVSGPGSSASVPDPSSSSPAPPPAPAAAEERPSATTVSPPPSYRESNIPHHSGPLQGCVRRGLLTYCIAFSILSLISVSLNIVGIVYCSPFADIGHGIWTAIVVTEIALLLVREGGVTS